MRSMGIMGPMLLCLLSGSLAWASVSDMIRLKSRLACPVDGFQFVDAAISQEPLKTWSFEQIVGEIASRRELNPRFGLTTDLNTIRQEVDQQNALRMLSIRGADSYIITEGGGPSPNRLASRSQSWQNVAGGVKRVAAGAGALWDWLGDGGVPVARELAQRRSPVCAGCPQNQPGDLTSWFTQPVAARIQAQIGMRSDLALTTPEDEKLNVCSACACPLKLKVHVPLKHITDHLSEQVKAALDPRCWILKEMQSTT